MAIEKEGFNMTELKIEENDPVRIVATHHIIQAAQYCKDSDTAKLEKVVQQIIDMAYSRGINDATRLVSDTQLELISQDSWVNKLEALTKN